MTQILPDCMMPDGADPCAGYQKLAARVRELEAERDALRAMLLKSYCYVAAHVPIGVKTDNDRKVLMLDIDTALAGGEPTP